MRESSRQTVEDASGEHCYVFDAGIDIKIAANGSTAAAHTSPEIYTHVTPPMQSDASERVASLILGKGVSI